MEKSHSFFSEFKPSNYQKWYEEVKRSLKGKDPESLSIKLEEGITIKPLYTKEDLFKISYISSEFPGLPNFLRSGNISGHKINQWHIVQRVEHPDPIIANEFILDEIKFGVNEFIFKQFNPHSTNKNGIILESLNAFNSLFQKVNIEEIIFHIETSFPYEFLSFFYSLCEQKGFDTRKFNGAIHYDFLSICTQKGKLPKDISKFELYFCNYLNSFSFIFPKLKLLTVDGTVFYESGANTVQELAFTLSRAVEYLRFLHRNGFPLDFWLSKFLFKLSIGSDFFLNLAKIRALRLLWSLILGEFNINPEKIEIPIYATTNKRNKSKLDVYVNMLRNSCETLTAILGSADYIEVTPFDFELQSMNEFSLRNSRNTQLVLLEEHNLIDTIDPVGGSWFLETFTYELASRTIELFKHIESRGGFIECIRTNFIQESISENQKNLISSLAERRKILIGTNKYPNLLDREFKTDQKTSTNIDEIFKTQNSQTKILDKVIPEDFKQISELAKGNYSFSSIIFTQKFFDEFIPINTINFVREPEEFEKLRIRAQNYNNKYGKFPLTLLVPFGKISDFKPILDFSIDFFQTGGFDTFELAPFQKPEDLLPIVLEKNPQVIVFCSTNEHYQNFVPQISSLIKKVMPLAIIALASLPEKQEDFQTFQNSGVDFFIYSKCDFVRTMNKIFDLILGNN